MTRSASASAVSNAWIEVDVVALIANPGIWTSAMPSPATVRTLWPSVARAPVH
jgi:hypothetical protein